MEHFGKLTEHERKLWQEFLEVRNLFIIAEERFRKLDSEIDCKKQLFWATVANRLKAYGKNLKLDEDTWEVLEMSEEDRCDNCGCSCDDDEENY